MQKGLNDFANKKTLRPLCARKKHILIIDAYIKISFLLLMEISIIGIVSFITFTTDSTLHT